MIAFEVSLNGKVVSTAGVKDFGVLTAILSWVRRRSDKARDGKTIEAQLTFEVGGLDSHNPDLSEHLVHSIETRAIQRGIHMVDVKASMNAEQFYLRCGYTKLLDGTFKYKNGSELNSILLRKKLNVGFGRPAS